MTLLQDNSNILFDNSQILHFSLVPFKAQLHLILKRSIHFQLSCSILFTSLPVSPQGRGKNRSKQAGWRHIFLPIFSNAAIFQILLCSNRHFSGLRKRLGQRGVLDLTFCDEILSPVMSRTDNAVFHSSKTAAGTTTSVEKLWQRCSVSHTKCTRTKLQGQG